MDKISLPKGVEIYTDFREQIGTVGKPFRLSGVAKNGKHWIYTFRYINTERFFSVEIDYNDKFYKFVK